MYRLLKLSVLLVFVSLFFTVSSVQADMKKGWYLGGAVGGGIAKNSDFKFLNQSGNGTLENGNGILLNAAAGYKFGFGFSKDQFQFDGKGGYGL